VSTDEPREPTADPTPETRTISPEELEKMRASWRASGTSSGAPAPSIPSSSSGLGKKLLGAVLIAAIGVGASIMSCVGQSFSYRQARAMEGIEQQLVLLRQGCASNRSVSSAVSP
jgi:uncharacterized protein HemX